MVNGGFSSNGVIDAKGNYTIEAPVGEVKIGVDNSMLNPFGMAMQLEVAQKGAGNPDAPPPTPVTGTYVEIPEKYSTPDFSGLTYTVTDTPEQTHNIELKKD
jgi:hypothetical protein